MQMMTSQSCIILKKKDASKIIPKHELYGYVTGYVTHTFKDTLKSQALLPSPVNKNIKKAQPLVFSKSNQSRLCIMLESLQYSHIL